MSDTPIDERRFSDAEIREILKRAVEKSTSTDLVKREGLSLAELKTIGEEVGISPDRLEDAARAVARGDRPRGNRLLGGPTVLDFERKVSGEFDRADTPEVLSLIRKTMGRQGEAEELHGSLEWRASGETGERYVTIASRDGSTTIRGSANLSQAAVVTFLPAGILGVVGSIVSFIALAASGSVEGLIILPFLVAAFVAVLRTIFSRIARSESRKLETVVDQLARLTERSSELE